MEDPSAPVTAAERSEVDLLRNELADARSELGVLRGQVLDLQDQLVSQRRRAEFLFRQNSQIADSRAYKVGRLLTAPVRVLRRVLRRALRRG